MKREFENDAWFLACFIVGAFSGFLWLYCWQLIFLNGGLK